MTMCIHFCGFLATNWDVAMYTCLAAGLSAAVDTSKRKAMGWKDLLAGCLTRDEDDDSATVQSGRNTKHRYL